MSDLTNSLEKLSREEALEAAQNLVLRVTQNASRSEREDELPKPFIDKPNENIGEIEQLARLILVTAAADPERVEAVTSLIEGAGRKEVVLEGTEIVVLATLGLFALDLLLRKGESSDRHTIEIEEQDGNTILVIESGISYGVSPSLGQLLKSYFER